MRNKSFKYILTLCLMCLLSLFITSGGSDKVLAEETLIPANAIATEESVTDPEPDTEVPTPTFEGYAISSLTIMDEYLYNALLECYSDYFYSVHGVTYSGTTIYSDMFKNFERIELNNKNITSLEGIENLDFDCLVSFSANSNKIETVKGSYFKYAEPWVLTEISFADNAIDTVDLTGLKGLQNIDFSSNLLTSIDLTTIEGKTTGTELTINLANNAFTSMDNIKLPTKRISHTNLNIINNNISSIPDSYFGTAYTLGVGIQGLNQVDNPTTDTARNIVYYKTHVSNLSVEIYKVDGEIDELIQTITDADITAGSSIKLNLPVGEYRFEYRLDGNPIDDRDYRYKYYLDECEFKVVPQQVICTFLHKGKEYTSLGKVTGKVTVNLASNDSDAKIFYQINSGEWIEGTEIQCNGGGSYSIGVKAVVDGVESLEQTVWVRTSLNLYIPDALMLVLVCLLALILFLIVLPVVSKKYFKKD